MEAEFRISNDSIDLDFFAPTQGWLAVGFNDRDAIVGSDLIQMRVRNGQVEIQDQLVTGLGQHPQDEELGGQNNIRILSGQEERKGTKIRCRIPLRSGDANDFQHQDGQAFWLILTYSVDDDFNHHSRLRRHRKIRWE